MARLIRVAPDGAAQHVMQRGNNRQVCFGAEEDMKAYLSWLTCMDIDDKSCAFAVYAAGSESSAC